PNVSITVLQAAQRTARCPVPSTTYSGHGLPHPGQCLSTNGSSLNALALVVMTPEAEALERIHSFSMKRAMPSPTSAPSTCTGAVTSWPPWKVGVIIGPQHP